MLLRTGLIVVCFFTLSSHAYSYIAYIPGYLQSNSDSNIVIYFKNHSDSVDCNATIRIALFGELVFSEIARVTPDIPQTITVKVSFS